MPSCARTDSRCTWRPPRPRGNLHARDGLRQEHRGLEVDVDDAVERLLRHVEQRLDLLRAGAIDEDVDARRGGRRPRRPRVADRRHDARMRTPAAAHCRAARATPRAPSALAASRPATTTVAPCLRERPARTPRRCRRSRRRRTRPCRAIEERSFARSDIEHALRPKRPRARNVTTAMNSRYIDSSDHSDAYAPVNPTTSPTISAGDDRAPEAADAAQHDDEERRHHRVDADVRAHAPDRRHHHAGESPQARRRARTRTGAAA